MNKKIISIFLALSVILSAVPAFAAFVANPASIYSDCDNKAVTELTKMEILSGDGNGKFRPNDTLTRAEFATMIAVARGIEYMPKDLNFSEDSDFPDVQKDFWGYRPIRFCATHDIIDGYEDGSFKPTENVSFAEAVKICLSAAHYDYIIKSDEDIWYKSWLEAAETYGFTDTKGKDPNKKITRLEAAELVYKTLDLPMCVVIGTKIVDGAGVPEFAVADGKTEIGGREIDLLTLRIKWFDWYKRD